MRAHSIVPGPIEGTEGLNRLASPLASYITRCVVVCDGGQNLVGSALFNRGAEQMLQAAGAA